MQSIEEKSDIIRDEIQREQEHRENSVNRLVEFRQVDVVRMEERIRGLVKDREEMEQALLKQTGEEFDKIKELMVEEQKARDESEHMITNALREITNQVQTEIDAERHEREKIEEHLLVLLEETF